MAFIHPHIANLLGILALGIWLHLFFGRGWFWRVGRMDADRGIAEARGTYPSVVAVIPARNEAETIARVLISLVGQDYPGPLSIVVVDDHSYDGTATIARQIAGENAVAQRVRVVSASTPPAGWTGKLWALQEGVSTAGISNAEGEMPAFYWLTDADVNHGPDTLSRL